MKLISYLSLLFLSLNSMAMVTNGASDCPTQFEGRVKDIIAPLGATEFFSANKVVFENQRTLRGEVSNKIILDILQNGPFKIETNKDYRVHLRSGKLCWMEEI